MTEHERERTHILWDELAVYPITETKTACERLMQSLAEWIEADQCGWLGTARMLDGMEAEADPMHGWRKKGFLLLKPPSKEIMQLAAGIASKPTDWGMASCALARRAGKFRAQRLRDGFIDYAAFKKTPHYKTYYTDFGIEDRIWVGFPVSEQTESFFIIDRRERKKRFTRKELDIASYTLRGLMWFHRRLLQELGPLLFQSPLTPTEQQVLRLLLTERSVKEIAAEIGLSFHTATDHIKQIYRKYRVDSRAGLMAIWLGIG